MYEQINNVRMSTTLRYIVVYTAHVLTHNRCFPFLVPGTACPWPSHMAYHTGLTTTSPLSCIPTGWNLSPTLLSTSHPFHVPSLPLALQGTLFPSSKHHHTQQMSNNHNRDNADNLIMLPFSIGHLAHHLLTNRCSYTPFTSLNPRNLSETLKC